MTRPTTGQSVHTPPNHCCTAVYQSSVVGRKMNPRTGHSSEGKRPSNQWVKYQSKMMASRGVKSARTRRTQGMVEATLLGFGLSVTPTPQSGGGGIKLGV